MKPAFAFPAAWLLSGLALAGGFSFPAQAADPYPYRMEMTPEEGRVDPRIERRFTPQLTDCQKRSPVTSAQANCFEDEFRRQDAKLNRVWAETLKRLPPAAHEPLRKAQRQWAAGRDPFCRTESDGYSGGTIAPVVYSNCRAEVTVRRTMWLEQLR